MGIFALASVLGVEVPPKAQPPQGDMTARVTTGDADDVAQLVLTQGGHSQHGSSTQPDQAQHQHQQFKVVRELHQYAIPRLNADAPQPPCHPIDRQHQLGITQPAFARYGRTPVNAR
jgi:hypothetical protein